MMTIYSQAYILPANFDVEDFTDRFNVITDGQVMATWDEADDGTVTLAISGNTDADEYMFNDVCDRMDDMIEDEIKPIALPTN